MAKILLDVDGVVCDFIAGYAVLARKVTGKTYKHAEFTNWDFDKCLALTKGEVSIIERMLFEPGFVRSLSSLNPAYKGVSSLQRAGHEIVFVTSPWKGHPTWAHEREQWLEERWPGCEVVSTHHKRHVKGDILVDDKPSHLESWLKDNNGIALLFDAPYNQTAIVGSRIFMLEQVLSHVPSLVDDPSLDFVGIP